MYSRSQFACLVGTKVSEIRYYERRGILLPEYCDEDNDRRYYSDESAETYRRIQSLQKAGYTLEEIQCHLDGSDGLTDEEFYIKRENELKAQLELLSVLHRCRTVEKVREKRIYVSPIAEKRL